MPHDTTILFRFVPGNRTFYSPYKGNDESIRLAGTLLTILPLIALYVIIQKQFVESIEKTGITGE